MKVMYFWITSTIKIIIEVKENCYPHNRIICGFDAIKMRVPPEFKGLCVSFTTLRLITNMHVRRFDHEVFSSITISKTQ